MDQSTNPTLYFLAISQKKSARMPELAGPSIYLKLQTNQKEKPNFSISTKEGAEKHLEFRKHDVELGHIVKGLLTTEKVCVV